MSHWTTVKTELKDQEILKAALERMGFKVQEGDSSVTQYGVTAKTQLKLDDAVGFSRQEDGTFAMVGDFYHSNDKRLYGYYNNNEKFMKNVSTAYGIERALDHYENLGFRCEENAEGNIGEDGLITLTFEK